MTNGGEPFPGFNTELASWEDEVSRWSQEEESILKQIELVQARVEDFNTGWLPKFLKFGQLIQPALTGLILRREQQTRSMTDEYNRLIDELDAAISQKKRATWFSTLYYSMPLQRSLGAFSTPQEMLNAYPYAGLSEEDRLSATQLFNKLLTQAPTSPEQAASTGNISADQETLIKILTSRPRPKPIGMHLLTTEEIFLALRTAKPPELPEGMTTEELRQLLKEAGLTDEELRLEIGTLSSIAQDYVNNWLQIEAQTEIVRSGLVDAKIPNRTAWEIFKEAAMRPGLAAMEAIELYRRYVSMPFAGAATLGVQALIPGTQEAEKLYSEAKETDNFWMAFSFAFENMNLNWGLKLAIEVLADPFTYVGIGIFTKLTRGIPVLGKVVGAAERGWLDAWDYIIFDRFKALWAKIPKTMTQEANFAGRAFTLDVRAALEQAVGQPIQRISPAEAEGALKGFIRLALDHPQSQSLEVTAGRWLLTRQPISEAQVSQWARAIGSPYKDDITMQMVSDIQMIVDNTAGFGVSKVHAWDEAVDLLLNKFGVSIDSTAAKTMGGLLRNLQDSIVAGAEKLTVRETTAEIIRKGRLHAFDTTFNSLKSPTFYKRQQLGTVSAMLNKVERTTLNSWRLAIDRYVVAPIARTYLMFPAYGPFNVIEAAMKSMLGKAHSIFYKPGSMPVARYQQLAQGLRNAVFEFVEATPRMEMAVLPIGRAAQMERLTRVFPPGSVGRVLNSMFVEWPGKVGLNQRAHYTSISFIKFLGEQYPEMMASLVKAVGKPPPGLHHKLTGMYRDLQQATLDRAISRGPSGVRAMADDITADRIAAAEVNEMVGKYTLVDPMIQDNFRVLADTGELYKGAGRGIDEAYDTGRNMTQELYFKSPEHYAEMYNDLSRQMANTIPHTEEQLMGHVALFDTISQRYGQFLEPFLSEARAKAVRMSPLVKVRFYDDLWSSISKYFEAGDEALGYMARNIKAALKKELEPVLDWEKITFKGVPDDVIASYKTMVEELPIEMRTQVKSIVVDDARIDRIEKEFRAAGLDVRLSGVWNEPSKSIVMRQEAIRDIAAVSHELAHGITSGRVLAGDVEFFVSYAESKGLVKLADGMRSGAIPIEFSSETQFIHESISSGFELYTTSPDILKSKAPKEFAWFEEHLPKKFLQVDMDDAQRELVLDFIDRRLALPELVKQTRTAQRVAEEEVLARYGGVIPKDPEQKTAFWNEFTTAREQPWITNYWPKWQTMMTEAEELKALIGRPILPPPIDTSARGLTIADISSLYGGMSDELARSIVDIVSSTVMQKSEFVGLITARANIVARQSGATADALGFTSERIGEVYDALLRSLAIDPTKHSILAPKMMQLEDIRQELWHIYRTKAIPEADLQQLQGWLTKVADDMDGTIPYKGAPNGSDDWWAAKEKAMELARKDLSKQFADYTNQNAIDDFMRSIFPFWTYEFHRWFWLPRTILRQPGVLLSVGKYMDYSEEGYIRIPGADIQFNPLRGTIFMGGMRRLILRDFPEYYDLFPGVSSTVDTISRFGFYPGIHVMLPQALFGVGSEGRRPELGELLPAWAKSPLDIYMAAFPESKSARALRDLIFPDRFRNYLTILAVNKRGQDGVNIWQKKLQGKPLTEEEDNIWAQASREIDLHGIYFEQTALFRFRPEEMQVAWDESSALIEEITGISVEQQEWMRTHGMRLVDYFPVANDPELQRLLQELDAFKIWSGVTQPLQPSRLTDEKVRIAQYWEAVSKIRERMKTEGIYDFENRLMLPSQEQLNSELRQGLITPETWRRRTSDMGKAFQVAINQLHEEEYSEIPVTLEERMKWYEEQGLMSPMEHPLRELMNLWFGITVERRLDPETGTMEEDWDRFFGLRDAILEAVPDDHRERFLKQVNFYDTDMERLQWFVNNEYIRPYRNRFDAVLTLFNPEEQQLIKEFYRTPSFERRQEIQDTLTDGLGLISTFQRNLTISGQNMRMLDPELDAWLLFWGYVVSPKTDEALIIYNELVRKYLGRRP